MSYLVRLLIVALLLAGPASAQNTGPPSLNYWWNGSEWVAVSSGNPFPIAGSFSATVGVAPLTSTNHSSTVSVSNTFQSIQVATAGRNGCTVQNNGTHTMWVFFGPVGSATEPTSAQLGAGQALSCSVGGLGVLTDQVSITGTAADAFYANFQ